MTHRSGHCRCRRTGAQWSDRAVDDRRAVLPRCMITRDFPTRRSNHEPLRPPERLTADLSTYADHEYRAGGCRHRRSQLLHRLRIGAVTSRLEQALASIGGTGGNRELTVKAADIPVGSGKVFPDAQTVITQPKAKEFKAFSSICTHQGCQVDAVTTTINCPCHGSKYSITDGSVVNPPGRSRWRQRRSRSRATIWLSPDQARMRTEPVEMRSRAFRQAPGHLKLRRRSLH